MKCGLRYAAYKALLSELDRISAAGPTASASKYVLFPLYVLANVRVRIVEVASSRMLHGWP